MGVFLNLDMIGMEQLVLGVLCLEYSLLQRIIWGNEDRIQCFGRVGKIGGYIYRDAWFKRRICIVSEYRELCIVLEDIGYFYQAGNYLGFECALVCLIISLNLQMEVTGVCGIM